MNRYRTALAGWMLFVFAAGIMMGWEIKNSFDESRASGRPRKDVREGQFELINPLLECSEEGTGFAKELRPFRAEMEKVIAEKKAAGAVSTVSVYYKDLNSGIWFGIGENETFLPASLLKVPIMISYFMEAQTNPGILKKKVKVEKGTADVNELETIRPKVGLDAGKEHTVEELIEHMIVYSDNNATLLLGNLGWSFSQKLYRTLGLALPNISGDDYQLDVKTYASFFRILFNASYLNREMSNKALDLLASTDFHRGIEAGVSPDIKVAHKFGERILKSQKQFHDCGIVYYPQHPYLICVMTRGNEIDGLVSSVEEISRTAYQEVNRQLSSK